MTARLHPAVQALVPMEDRAPATHDDRRSGDVDGVGVLVERSGQLIEAVEDPPPGFALPGVGRYMAGDGTTDGLDETGRPAAVLRYLPAASRHVCIVSTSGK